MKILKIKVDSSVASKFDDVLNALRLCSILPKIHPDAKPRQFYSSAYDVVKQALMLYEKKIEPYLANGVVDKNILDKIIGRIYERFFYFKNYSPESPIWKEWGGIGRMKNEFDKSYSTLVTATKDLLKKLEMIKANVK